MPVPKKPKIEDEDYHRILREEECEGSNYTKKSKLEADNKRMSHNKFMLKKKLAVWSMNEMSIEKVNEILDKHKKKNSIILQSENESKKSNFKNIARKSFETVICK